MSEIFVLMKLLAIVSTVVGATVTINMTISVLIPTIYAQENTTAPTPTAPNQRSAAELLAETVNSVALLIGVVAPLIVSGLAYVKSRSQDPKIDKALETGISVGKVATATANKALENKENIKSLIETGLKVSPEELQKAVEERKALIEKLNKEIQATNAQIKRLAPLIPGEANADSIPDLPREKDF
jgi:predicted transcriptional regulator